MKALLLLCLCSYVLVAQDVTEQMSVVFRDVRVHVVDKDGDPVTDLKAEDFILKEGDFVQELGYFEEVDQRSQLAQRDPEEHLSLRKGRAIVIYLDTSNLEFDAFEPLMEGARALITSEAGPGVEMKLVHFDEEIKHITDFTQDPATLLKGLSEVKYYGHFRQKLIAKQRAVTMAHINFLRLEEGNENIRDPEEELKFRKALVEDRILEKEREKKNHFHTYFNQMNAIANMLQHFPQSKNIYHLSGGVYLESSGNLQNTEALADELGWIMNQKNVTVYSFVQRDREVIGNSFVRLSRERMDTLGYTGDLGNSLFENHHQLQSGPKNIALKTGGYYLNAVDRGGVNKRIIALVQSAKHYYRLGYSVEESLLKKKIKIQFAQERRGWKLIYGKRFKLPKPFTDYTKGELRSSFESALLYSVENRNDLDCDYQFQRFQGDDGKVLIPVAIDLPARSISAKGFQVGLAAFGKDRFLHDIVTTRVDKPPTGAGLRLHHVLVADQAPELIRFFVRDLDTGVYSIQQATALEDYTSREGLSISELVLFQPDDFKLMPLNMMGEIDPDKPHTALRRDKDPLKLNDTLARGKLLERFPKGQPVDIFFHLDNVTNPQRLSVNFILINNEEETLAKVQTIKILRDGEAKWKFHGRVNDLDLPDGDYELKVLAQDVDSKEKHTRVIPLRIGSI